MNKEFYTLGIDIGSTTVKIAILDTEHTILFSDYKRHYANIRETLSSLLEDAFSRLGNLELHPMITGSGGLTLVKSHLNVPFVQEVIAVSTALKNFTHPRQMLPSNLVVKMPRLFILQVAISNSV